jgi:hypothetical protein
VAGWTDGLGRVLARESGERRPVEDHLTVESVDKGFKFGDRRGEAGDRGPNLFEGRPTIEVTKDLLEGVEGDENLAPNQPE